MPIDPNNQNYFSLDEQTPVVLPWWKVRKNQMRILAAVGIAVGVGIVGYYGYQTYSLTHVDVAKVDQAKNIIANAAASCATDKDPKACEDRARSDAARTTGQSSVCSGLSDKKLTNCVTLIAMDLGDKDVCAVLSGSDQSKCENEAVFAAATRAGDYGMCSSITDDTVKTTCEAQLVSVVIAAGECAKYGIDDTVCGFQVKLDAVVASGNPSGCAQFSDEQMATCEDMFSSLDQDGDGLSLLAEYKLGTSDTNADTDGDGYTDNQEVASGHDPLK
ncbi:MAG: thrombospondin type 3 repeat-containing protein [Patescibacteria group bacterium]